MWLLHDVMYSPTSEQQTLICKEASNCKIDKCKRINIQRLDLSTIPKCIHKVDDKGPQKTNCSKRAHYIIKP